MLPVMIVLVVRGVPFTRQAPMDLFELGDFH